LSEENISIPNFKASGATDRQLRQAVLTILYRHHADHPERYEFFDITIEFLARSLNLQPSDILRVIKPMEDEKEIETSEQSRYVRITSKGIRMIDEEPLFERLNTAGVRVMGDQYNVSGQAAAVGPGAKAEGNTFNQIQINQDIDMQVLAKELEQLSEHLAADARDPEKEEDIATVVLAKKAAQRGDKVKVLELLSSVGKWVIDAATQTGASLAAAIIQKQLGL
jgi:benzoyl-CoA reductase/2-hydroxyglutaryl-CoA dehydratase subunit BcrC/BadD/HgdB